MSENTIAVLSTGVANQIAAGEVVERPASVVRELLDNALDASAHTIEITIEEGGKSLIRVSDDGLGMSKDDAKMALERHATSKIRTAEDLAVVSSFGFRGEALPAISSVSELILETSLNDGEGSRIESVGGKIVSVSEVSRRRGTTITVSRLFYNTPARRKFLKGEQSEQRAIQEIVFNIAVLRRDVHIVLKTNTRILRDIVPSSDIVSRVSQLWGNQFTSRFLQIDDVLGVYLVRGLIERPSEVGTGPRRVVLMVNGRNVRDPGITRAVESAYRSTIAVGARPSMILELTVPARSIDVNVHPAKSEIRLHDRWNVEQAVTRIIQRALGGMASASGSGFNDLSLGVGNDTLATDPQVSFDSMVPSFVLPFKTDGEHRGLQQASSHEIQFGSEDRTIEDVNSYSHEISIPHLVQLRRTWMMFEHNEGIVLIDQHSAHERIIYERYMNRQLSPEKTIQGLLIPLTLHLSAEESDAFERNSHVFSDLGFQIEAFGGHTLIVHSAPMPHPRFDALFCLRESLSAFAGDRSTVDATRYERFVSTIACKSAIKAGEYLSQLEMQALYRDLAKTSLPYHDIHGRAAVVKLSWDELERRFGRT